MDVAAVIASDGDERARAREGESREGRRGSGESEREQGERRGVVQGIEARRRGQAEVEDGGAPGGLGRQVDWQGGLGQHR